VVEFEDVCLDVTTEASKPASARFNASEDGSIMLHSLIYGVPHTLLRNALLVIDPD
jgi:hypothetical protein